MGKFGSLFNGFMSLGQDINKSQDNKETEEGVVEPYLEELKLDKPDDELIALAKSWTDKWNTHYKDSLQKKQIISEKYWLGKTQDLDSVLLQGTVKTSADNLIFEALETFLPVATQQKPEPLVSSDDTQEGIDLAKKVRNMLVYLSDIQSLKIKLKNCVRNWALSYFGVMKIGWDEMEDDITLKVIQPKNMILDPDAIIDGGWYKGEYIGEVKTESASTLIERFPSQKEFIVQRVNNKLGTQIKYTEWWTNLSLFWTYEGRILGKYKNPHWNYNSTEAIPQMGITIDEFGNEVESPNLDENGEQVMDIKETRGLNQN